MAPPVGFEPTTLRLTAECSTAELRRNKISGEDLLFRAVSSQVSSARESLTSVFGMGTGVASPLVSPEWLEALGLRLQNCIEGVLHDGTSEKVVREKTSLFMWFLGLCVRVRCDVLNLLLLVVKSSVY